MEQSIPKKRKQVDLLHDRDSKTDPLHPLRRILLATYSQESLAKMCEVNRSTISRVFNGTAKPSYKLEILLYGFASAVLNEYEDLDIVDEIFHYKTLFDNYKFPKYPHKKYPMNGAFAPTKVWRNSEGENNE
ncbi:MAG: helix-turn-helix transcriptional regulator [Immundisolibacteraceae bacterium]|nr:helix-turn-helix transcriptional regulator [Immundisolibacteraceae bacterium]